MVHKNYLNSSAAKRSFCRHWNIYSVRQEESWYLCFHKAKEPFSSWIQSRNYFSCQSLTWRKSSLHQCGAEAIGGENWVSTEENRATAQRIWSYFQSCMIKAMWFFLQGWRGPWWEERGVLKDLLAWLEFKNSDSELFLKQCVRVFEILWLAYFSKNCLKIVPDGR